MYKVEVEGTATKTAKFNLISGGVNMQHNTRMKLLKIALAAFGLFFIFGLWPMMHFFKDSWGWSPPQYEYEQMFQGVYATLGVFLILAAKNPLEHRSLIWFTVWSSFVHGAIMFFQAIYDKTERANLYGDIPALILVALILSLLMPRKKELEHRS